MSIAIGNATPAIVTGGASGDDVHRRKAGDRVGDRARSTDEGNDDG